MQLSLGEDRLQGPEWCRRCRSTSPVAGHTAKAQFAIQFKDRFVLEA